MPDYKEGITYPCTYCAGTGQFKLEPKEPSGKEDPEVKELDPGVITVEWAPITEKDVLPMTEEQKDAQVKVTQIDESITKFEVVE